MDRSLGDDGYLGSHNLGQTPTKAILLACERRCSGQFEMATISRQVGGEQPPARIGCVRLTEFTGVRARK